MIAIIHSIPIIYIYRRYSDDYLASIFIFAAMGCHLAWMMNGVRQFVAVGIIFMSTPALVRKNYVPVVISIIVAYFIHSSAIIMLPIVFIVQGKAFNKKTILYILAAVVLTYLFATYTNLADTLLEGTDYDGAISEWRSLGDDGANPLWVLISAVPGVLAFIGRKRIEEENDPMVNICINMSIVTMGLYAVAAVTSGVMVGRLPIYTSLYSHILMPHIVRKAFRGRAAAVAYFAMIVFYFIFSRF